MPRVTNIVATKQRRQRLLREARGYYGYKSKLYRYAKMAVQRAGAYAYRDRRKKKSDMRRLWIIRINAACRPLGVSYSRFINGLTKAGIIMDRKAMSELAIHDEAAFKVLVQHAQAALGKN